MISKILIKSKLAKGVFLENIQQHKVSTLLDNTLFESLRERINYPYKFDTKSIKNTVIIYVELKEYGV